MNNLKPNAIKLLKYIIRFQIRQSTCIYWLWLYVSNNIWNVCAMYLYINCQITGDWKFFVGPALHSHTREKNNQNLNCNRPAWHYPVPPMSRCELCHLNYKHFLTTLLYFGTSYHRIVEGKDLPTYWTVS